MRKYQHEGGEVVKASPPSFYPGAECTGQERVLPRKSCAETLGNLCERGDRTTHFYTGVEVAGAAGRSEMTTDLEAGVLLFSATLPMGTSTLVSGK